MHRFLFIILILCILPACGTSYPYVRTLMPAPLYKQYAHERNGTAHEAKPAVIPVMFATDRAPSNKSDREPHYRNERGEVLRLGEAVVRIGEPGAVNAPLPEDALRGDVPVEVTGAEEYGVLSQTAPWVLGEKYAGQSAGEFWDRLNERLAEAPIKDITVFVHGFRVVFENPLVVAGELAHSMGRESVVMAYSWPSTPSMWAYFADLETARISARTLRIFLNALAAHTNAEHINIVGYSAGTRVVLDALRELRLENASLGKRELAERFRINNVVLIGSDVDRQIFGTFYGDGLMDIAHRLTIYVSQTDEALASSQWIFGRGRLGETGADQNRAVTEYLGKNEHLAVIDVTGAESAQKGNGHHYFRHSPWVSNDMLLLLNRDLSPAGRGLVRDASSNYWKFPEDYPERIRGLVSEH